MYTQSLAPKTRITKTIFVRFLPFVSSAHVGSFRLLTKSFLLIQLSVLNPCCVGAEPLQEWVTDQLPQLTQLYKDLHRHPELSFQEEQTAAKMAGLLRELEFEVTERVGGHGVVGVMQNGSGRTLLLRADMDALPVVEQTGLPYASQATAKDERGVTVGVMHACGHDVHMANLIGTLRYLAEHRDLWQGTIVAIFQPAEERGAGAKAMLEDGLFVRFPRPDYALAIHVSADMETGKVGYRAGYAMANVDSVDVTIQGRGGHGASPHTTIDPVVIAAQLVVDLQSIVSREINPVEPAVITVGSIQGGTKHNIIGDTCHLQLTVRSYTPEVRKHLLDGIRRKALAAAAGANAPEPTVSVSEGTPSLFNDPELTERVVDVLRDKLGDEKLEESEPSMGGEDFGRYGRAGVPIVMLRVGAVNAERLDEYKQEGVSPPSLHSPKFYPDFPETITTGVTAMTAASLDLLHAEDE